MEDDLEYQKYLTKVKDSGGWVLEFVPLKHRTFELCEIAVTQTGYALEWVPEHLKSPELCNIAVNSRGYALEFVPEELKTRELCEIALEDVLDHFKDEFLESYVPEEFHKEFKKTNERGR